MLRVTLLGNLGGEPEVRFTQKGTQFVQFSVAVNQVRLGPDGERQENTEWFRIKVVGPTDGICAAADQGQSRAGHWPTGHWPLPGQGR